MLRWLLVASDWSGARLGLAELPGGDGAFAACAVPALDLQPQAVAFAARADPAARRRLRRQDGARVSAEMVITIAFYALLVFGYFYAVGKIWRGESEFDGDDPPAFWPFSVELWRGAGRAMPVLGLGGLILIGAGIVSDLVGKDSPGYDLVMAIGTVGLLLTIFVGFPIMYLSRPELLVPPIWREDPPIYPRRRAQGSADERRRDLADGLRRLAARPGSLRNGVASIAPDASARATAPPNDPAPPAGVAGGRSRGGGRRLRGRRHALDCVRLASLGLIEDFEPDLIVSGINHGSTWRRHHLLGTVTAALEGVYSASRRSPSPSSPPPARWTSAWACSTSPARRSPRGSSTASTTCRCPKARCSTSTCRPARSTDVGVAHLGKRIYRDQLSLINEESRPQAVPDLRRRARATTTSPAPTCPPIARGRIAVTPLHFDLTDRPGHRDAAGL